MTIAFTGHREYDAERTNDMLYRSVVEWASQCDVTFLSGMAVGFDLAAGEAVLEARRNGYSLKLKCVVPYADQSRYFSDEDILRYNDLLEAADEVIILSESYSRDVFFQRNDYLVESADLIISYFNGINRGGTAYTVRKARRVGVPVQNLYPQQQLSLF
ncbi:MAG: SLOG family protein [Rikenellaceae bacterium]